MRRTNWEGAAGLMFNLPYYGLDKQQRLSRVCHDHLDMCGDCNDAWLKVYETIPDCKMIEELAALIIRGHDG